MVETNQKKGEKYYLGFHENLQQAQDNKEVSEVVSETIHSIFANPLFSAISTPKDAQKLKKLIETYNQSKRATLTQVESPEKSIKVIKSLVAKYITPTLETFIQKLETQENQTPNGVSFSKHFGKEPEKPVELSSEEKKTKELPLYQTPENKEALEAYLDLFRRNFKEFALSENDMKDSLLRVPFLLHSTFQSFAERLITEILIPQLLETNQGGIKNLMSNNTTEKLTENGIEKNFNQQEFRFTLEKSEIFTNTLKDKVRILLNIFREDFQTATKVSKPQKKGMPGFKKIDPKEQRAYNEYLKNKEIREEQERLHPQLKELWESYLITIPEDVFITDFIDALYFTLELITNIHSEYEIKRTMRTQEQDEELEKKFKVVEQRLSNLRMKLDTIPKSKQEERQAIEEQIMKAQKRKRDLDKEKEEGVTTKQLRDGILAGLDHIEKDVQGFIKNTNEGNWQLSRDSCKKILKAPQDFGHIKIPVITPSGGTRFDTYLPPLGEMYVLRKFFCNQMKTNSWNKRLTSNLYTLTQEEKIRTPIIKEAIIDFTKEQNSPTDWEKTESGEIVINGKNF